MNITSEHLNALTDFQHNATVVEFRQIFHGAVADHLWDKFEGRCNSNLLMLYSLMDDRNAALLVNRLNQLLQEGE
jgi:hypothetical protein